MSHFEGKPEKYRAGKISIPEDVSKHCSVMGIEERGISLVTASRYGIYTEVSELTGEKVAHYFPHFKKGRLSGYVRRDLTRAKKQAWSVVGDVDIECSLYGWHCRGRGQDGKPVGPLGQDAQRLYIVEGMYDAPSLWQALNNKSPGSFNVVSIPLGTKNALRSIKENIEWIKRHKEIVTIFDMDQATPEELQKGVMKGKEATQEVQVFLQSVLKGERKTVTWVALDKKDPNEYLLDGQEDALANLALYQRVAYEPESIALGGGSLEEINTPLGSGISLEFLPSTMRLLQGLRPAELTVLLAPPKCGKTTVCKEIHYALLQQGIPTMGMYLEEDTRKSRQSFVAMDNNIPLPRFRRNPSEVPLEDQQRTLDTILSPALAMFADNAKGHIGPERCLTIMEYAHVQGAKFIILDHLSYVFSGADDGDERKGIDKLLTDIAAFVRRTGVHVIVVAHIKRMPLNPPKERDGTIRYPFWQEVDEYSGRGSGAFEQICFNMLAIDKEIKEDKTRGLTRLKVLYNREWDWTGVGDYLTMDPETGRMKAVNESAARMRGYGEE